MTQRIAQQCLRTSIKTINSATRIGINRQCIRKHSSAAPQRQQIDPSSPEASPPPQRPAKSRTVLPQGAHPSRPYTNTDLLPFDPPPSSKIRHLPSISIRPRPNEEDTTVESVFPANQRGPIPLRIRKPFPVNQSWELLHNFYSGLFGFDDYIEKGYLTKDLAWQSITYKSYNHGVDPYNEKLAHLGTPSQPIQRIIVNAVL